MYVHTFLALYLETTKKHSFNYESIIEILKQSK